MDYFIPQQDSRREASSRRDIDRALMNGEWPVLLKVMGKNAEPDRYLSLDELRVLFTVRRLPERICERIDSHVNAVSAM